MRATKMRSMLLMLVMTYLGLAAVICSAAPNMDDLWAGNARFYLDTRNVGSSFNMHFCSMMWQGSELWSYYIKLEPAGGGNWFYGVGRARSTDGLSWTDDGWALHAGGVCPWIWYANQSAYHQTGRTDGDGWSARVGDPAGYLNYGPYTDLIPYGNNCAWFILQIDNNSGTDNVARIEVYDTQNNTVVATKTIKRNEFAANNSYQGFYLNYATSWWGHQMQFRTYYYGNCYLKQQSSADAQGSYPAWDTYDSSFPGVWKHTDGNYYMVYEGAGGPGYPGDIGLAMAGDGLNFIRHAVNPILSHNTFGWENCNIGTPSLRNDAGTWYLYYHGYDWTDCRIGVATGTSILALSKYASNPVINTVSNTWESGTCGKRSTLIQAPSGYWYMAYEGSGEQPYTATPWSTGIARSSNKMDWTKYSSNPVIPQTTNTMGNDGPELVQIGGYIYMYVRAWNPAGGCDRYRLDW